MRKLSTFGLAVVLGGVVVSGVAAVVKVNENQELPELPANPATADVVLQAAIPFHLGQPAVHHWQQDKPTYQSGYLLVLKVDRDLAHPRQMHEPVLYAGATAVARINSGHLSGSVVAIAPSLSGQDIDLTATPIFYGQPALPEELTVADIQKEIQDAQELGVVAPSHSQVTAALRPARDFASDHELRRFAATLLEEFSPVDRDLITGLQVPVVDR